MYMLKTDMRIEKIIWNAYLLIMVFHWIMCKQWRKYLAPDEDFDGLVAALEDTQ